MMVLGTIFSFVFGAIVGSFLNVVALRYNTGATLRGRSRCFACARDLQWFDLVPIASFLVLRGRCRSCGSSISLQYPIVELLTGIVFALIFLQQTASSVQQTFFSFDAPASTWLPVTSYQLLVTSYRWLVWSLLIAISVYDLRHKIIPNGLVYIFIALAFLNAFDAWNLFGNWKLEIGNLVHGPLLAAPLAGLWLLSGGRWMGLGDAKLAAGIGWLLGLSRGITALALSFWFGALISLGVLLAQRLGLFFSRGAVTMKSEIPFGPFLVVGTFLAWFFELDVAALVRWF